MIKRAREHLRTFQISYCFLYRPAHLYPALDRLNHFANHLAPTAHTPKLA